MNLMKKTTSLSIYTYLKVIFLPEIDQHYKVLNFDLPQYMEII